MKKKTQIDETLHTADSQNNADGNNSPSIGSAQEQSESANPDGAATGDIPATQIAQSDDGMVARLVAEAEQRGYMRGLNERMTELIDRPGLYEDLARRAAGTAGDSSVEDKDPLTSGFLSTVRASVWD